MRGTVIGIIRQFICDRCHESRKAYITSTEPPPECCGEPMAPVVEGRAVRASVFPYVTTHLDGLGTPIEIQDIHHLRRLEKQYGVVVHGFSNNSGSEFKDLPRQRPGGREYEL